MIPIANLAALLSLASSSLALAINNDGNLNIPLVRRGVRSKSEDEWREYRDFVTAKFTPGSSSTKKSKRASSVDVPLTNLEFDTSYFAQVSIGTPGTSFNVILDTGSSDLWVASNQCQCTQSATFNPTSSSSLQTSQQTVDLQYGSGEAQGFLVEDTVAIGGFSVSKQEFVLAEQVSQGLLQGSLSGLLGLGFQSIAQTQAVPLIEALAQGNQLTAQEISFYLNRLIDEQSAPSEAPGGTFTIGGTNSSLFQGDIDFVDLPSNVQPSFWLLPVTAVGVQGTTLTVNSGTQSLAAIDTGTTLIGGPSNAVAEIYSKIPGSQSLSGQMQGYFSVPCSTTIQTSFTFSSKTWPISPEDFTVQQLQGNQCLGALFGLDLGSQGGPDWVIGDTFLKNVYSVFRFSPGPSVGFAELASNLQGSSAASTPESTHTGSLPGNPLPSSSGSSPFGSGGNNPFTDSGAAASLRVGLGSTLGLISLALLSGILVL